MLTLLLSNLESSPNWTKEWDTSINPTKADGFEIIQTSSGLRLYCTGEPYSGYLAKHADPLPILLPNITFSYTVTVDDCTSLCGQVIETDFKLTDSQGWTYDGSGQWNIAEGWIWQVGNPWIDTPVKIAPMLPGVPCPVQVKARIDYSAHTITIVSVVAGGVEQMVGVTIPARQVGWGVNEIVTQLQQCMNGKEGAYSLLFNEIGYQFS